MASTNKTTNYELSQYIGSDKPTYLGDYNADMLKIDTQMKANSDAVESARAEIETTSQTANTAIQNANIAQTTAEQAQVTGTTANETAVSALTKANQNESKLNEFNINNFLTISTNLITPTNASLIGSSLKLATNDANSMFKLYGRLVFQPTNNGNSTFKFASPLRPAQRYQIQTLGINFQHVNRYEAFVEVDTDGTITITVDSSNAGSNVLFLFPCLLFNKSFTD